MAESMRCVNHPDTETYLRCSKCGRPICTRCIVQTPVGYRCRDCVGAQQQVFYADFRPVHYLIAAAVALPLSLVAGWLVPALGWLYAVVFGPLTGILIADAARWAIQRRRGKYTWLVVCGCIALGALPRLLMSLLVFAGASLVSEMSVYAPSGLLGLVWGVVYMAGAAGSAYLMLRPGRRV
jgi:hypothetical protein